MRPGVQRARKLVRVGFWRRVFGGPAARVLGLIDGWLGAVDKSVDELHKFKDRAELFGAEAATWWSHVAGGLNGDCAALAARIRDSDESITRLSRDVEVAHDVFVTSGTNDAETRLRRFERDLLHSRNERAHLLERLLRAEQTREASYQRARSAALSFKEHYESVMRSYKASNRKSLDTLTLPEVMLPDILESGALSRESGTFTDGAGRSATDSRLFPDPDQRHDIAPEPAAG